MENKWFLRGSPGFGDGLSLSSFLSVKQSESPCTYINCVGDVKAKKVFFQECGESFLRKLLTLRPGRGDFPAREIMIKSLTGISFSWYLSPAICMGLETEFY